MTPCTTQLPCASLLLCMSLVPIICLPDSTLLLGIAAPLFTSVMPCNALLPPYDLMAVLHHSAAATDRTSLRYVHAALSAQSPRFGMFPDPRFHTASPTSAVRVRCSVESPGCVLQVCPAPRLAPNIPPCVCSGGCDSVWFPLGLFLLVWNDAVLYQEKLFLLAGCVAMLRDWTGV